MTARRMLAVPWWVFLLLAPLAYVLIAYGAPTVIDARSAALIGPAVTQVFAPFVALLILFVAVRLALRQRRARQLVDQQTGLESIRSLRWDELERLVGEVYRRRGYSVVETGGGGADGGIDLILTKDGRYLVQCKHWNAFTVSVKEVRELFGIVTAEGAAGGILVTSGRFTHEAKAFARGKPIEMVEGRTFLKLVRDVRSATTLPAVVDVATAAEENRPSGGRRCPRCGQDMVVRTARQGVGAGSSSGDVRASQGAERRSPDRALVFTVASSTLVGVCLEPPSCISPRQYRETSALTRGSGCAGAPSLRGSTTH